MTVGHIFESMDGITLATFSVLQKYICIEPKSAPK